MLPGREGVDIPAVADIAVAGIVVDTVAAVAGVAAPDTGVVGVVPPAAAEAHQTWLHSWCKIVPHRPLQPHSSCNISPWISSFENVEQVNGFASGSTVFGSELIFNC